MSILIFKLILVKQFFKNLFLAEAKKIKPNYYRSVVKMAKIVEPTTQFLVPTPNEHVNYVFETTATIEEYRTARYLNKILTMFGKDKVIKKLNMLTAELTANTVTIGFNDGVLVQDSTLIKVLYPFEKELVNLSTACQTSDDYYVVVYTDFNFSPVTSAPTTNPNQFNVYIGVLDNVSHILYSTDPTTTGTVITWDTDVNRIVLYAASITDLTTIPATINIASNIYNIRKTIQVSESSETFNYERDNDIDYFNGGVLNFSDDNAVDMVSLLESLRPYIVSPVNVSPANLAIDITETPTLSSDEFECINGSDVHLNSDWEIYSNSSLSTLEWSSYTDTTNKVSIDVPAGELLDDTDYWWRCKHTGTTYSASAWSTSTKFTTVDIYIDTPVNISPANLAINITETPTLSSDAFECINGSDVHLNSDWEIYSDSELSTLEWSSYTDTTNKVSIDVPAGELLEGDTDYWWRCKHTGTFYGASAWSTSTKFTTLTLFT